MAALWIGGGGVVYLIGFVIAGVLERRYCDLRDHRYCNHPWETPIPLMWPLALVFALSAAPVFLPILGAARLSNRLGESSTEKRRRADDERAHREREMAETIARLEREVGLR